MAPQVGLEPTTLRLTAGCSAIELLRSGSTLACVLELAKKSYQRLQRIGNSRIGSSRVRSVSNDRGAAASSHQLTAYSLPRVARIVPFESLAPKSPWVVAVGERARPSGHCSANLSLGVSSTTGVRCLCWEVCVC